MSTVENELESFTQFAKHQIGTREGDVRIDELFDQWRTENPSDEHYAENVAAIRASIVDFKNGEWGTIAGEHSAELRRTFRSSGE